MKLIDLVKNQKVHFYFARHNQLWYITDSGFVFPVPFDDMGDGTFLAEDKAILFMRYIRKQLDRMSEEEKLAYERQLNK
jgi:hypothetical protein